MKLLRQSIARVRARISRAVEFPPELFDLMRWHAQSKTRLGKLINFSLKCSFLTVRFLIRSKRALALGNKGSTNTRQMETMPWHAPLTCVSSDKGRRILIVAEVTLPQCYKYRVKQKQEMFEHLGYEVTVCDWRDPALVHHNLQLHGLVVFYRVPAFETVDALLDECQRLAVPTCFDVDDLIFCPNEYQSNSNLDRLSASEREEILSGALLYQQALKRCDHAIASTQIIAEKMAKFCQGDIHVLENCIDSQSLALMDSCKDVFKNNKLVTIGYGSGTNTHDIDFLECEDAVVEILTTYPQVRLAVHGHLNLSEKFDAVKEQVLMVPFLDAEDYYRSMASFDINIAPLEPSTFNEAKSNIKYLEAAVFAIPTVASPTQPFYQAINSGENGFICGDKQQWLDALKRLVENADFRCAMGAKAKQQALETYSYKNIATTQLAPLIDQFLPEPKVIKTKVLVCNILFKPISFGGATLVAEELAREVHENSDLDVTIFTGFWDDKDTGIAHQQVVRYEVMGMPVIAARFPAVMTPTLEYKNGELAKVFADVLAAVQPDLVHLHSIQQLSASLAEECLEKEIPYLITLHDAWWLCEKQFMINKAGKYCAQEPIDLRVCASCCVPDSAHTYRRSNYLRKLLNGATKLLTPSEFQKQFYIGNGIEGDRLLVNKNGVLPPQADFFRTASEKIRFAYLGGNATHKGYQFLKDVFETLTDDNYKLIIADIQKKLGQPSVPESDWALAGEVEINDGFTPETIDDYFANIDVLLMPSQWKESFGLTVREALIRGIWVITTDSGGTVEDIVEGKNGNVVPMGDVSRFRLAVEQYLKEQPFPPAEMQSAIRTYPEQARELAAIYQSELV